MTVQYPSDMAEADIDDNGSDRLSENERRAIISRIHSMLYWVGMFVHRSRSLRADQST